MPEWILEDENPAGFSLRGKKTGYRVPHKRGCRSHDLVILKRKNGGFYVGKIMKRDPDNPLLRIIVHMYGNLTDKLLGTYTPTWIDKDGDRRFQMKGGKFAAWEESFWIEEIASWSCDWSLGADRALPMKLLWRLHYTSTLDWTMPASRMPKAKKSKAK